MNSNLRLEEWQDYIKIINSNAQNILVSRSIFERYIEIVNNNPDIQNPSDFHLWVMKNYGRDLASNIRSQIDPTGITIGRLLTEIQRYPKVLSKEWYISCYKPLEIHGLKITFADSIFKSIAGTGEFFDSSIAKEDYNLLKILADDIKNFVNMRIAHHNTRMIIKKDITYRDLHMFVNEYERIVKKYILLLNNEAYTSLEPTAQYDWDEIFRKAWIK